MNIGIHQQILLWAFGIACLLGAVSAKTRFCTLGGVSDWVNMGDTGRMRAWMFATATAVAGAALLDFAGLIDLSVTASIETAFPPYRTPVFTWPRYLVGGLLFGIGMALAGGCGARALVRVGGGNLKALVVVAVMGVAAWSMLYTSLDYYLFLQWMGVLSPDLAAWGVPAQDLGTLTAAAAGSGDGRTAGWIIAAVLAPAVFAWCLASSDFRRLDPVLGAVATGLAVTATWYLSAGPPGQAWMEAVLWMETPPPATGAQGLTFIAPTGQTVRWLLAGGDLSLVTLAMASAGGMIAGSALWSLVRRGFHFEWFADRSDFIRHIIGAVLMGTGGVLAMGCTIGQGVTGLSTLAAGAFIALAMMILGSALTLKVQVYLVMYDDARFIDALLSALADLHLLPQRLRRLESV